MVSSVQFEETVQSNMFFVHSDIVGFRIKWTIHDFNRVRKEVTDGKCIEMKEAIDLSFGKRNLWTIWINPKLNGTNRMGAYLMFFNSLSEIERCCAVYKMSVPDHDDISVKFGFRMHCFHQETKFGRTGYGFDDIFNIDNSLIYFPNGNLTIVFEGAVFLEHHNFWNYQDIGSKLVKGFLQLHKGLALLESKSGSDIVFVVDDERIAVHKDIMIAGSPVFASFVKYAEDHPNPLSAFRMTKIRKEIFKELVHYIYTKSVTQNFQKIPEKLFVKADKYDLEEMKNLCEIKLLNSIYLSNAVLYYSIGHSCHSDRLKNKSSEFILKNRKQVELHNEGFKVRSSKKCITDSVMKFFKQQKNNKK